MNGGGRVDGGAASRGSVVRRGAVVRSSVVGLGGVVRSVRSVGLGGRSMVGLHGVGREVNRSGVGRSVAARVGHGRSDLDGAGRVESTLGELSAGSSGGKEEALRREPRKSAPRFVSSSREQPTASQTMPHLTVSLWE